MDDAQLGRAVRALRHRRGWRQADLAARAGLSSSTVSLVERGHARDLSTRTVQAVAYALGARLAWRLDWRGGELDSTLDADHAALQEIVAGMLQQHGWHTIAEASFNRFGDRGRIDLLGFHAASRTLLVIEVKTMIADIQDLLGRLDVKVRVAPALAATRGWRPAETRAALIVLDGSTPRRRVAQHAALFARFSLRGANATRWLRGPRQDAPAQGVGPPGLLVFVPLSSAKRVGARKAGRQRVRQNRARRDARPALRRGDAVANANQSGG